MDTASGLWDPRPRTRNLGKVNKSLIVAVSSPFLLPITDPLLVRGLTSSWYRVGVCRRNERGGSDSSSWTFCVVSIYSPPPTHLRPLFPFSPVCSHTQSLTESPLQPLRFFLPVQTLPLRPIRLHIPAIMTSSSPAAVSPKEDTRLRTYLETKGLKFVLRTGNNKWECTVRDRASQ